MFRNSTITTDSLYWMGSTIGPFDYVYTPKPVASTQKTDTAYNVLLAIPGYKKEDLKIEVQDRVLSVFGESKSRQIQFSKTVELPEHLETPEATLEDGILCVSFSYSIRAQKQLVPIKAR